MKSPNNKLNELAETIEKRVIQAVIHDMDISGLMAEVDLLYKNEEISEDDYNFLTDTELIKEIYI